MLFLEETVAFESIAQTLSVKPRVEIVKIKMCFEYLLRYLRIFYNYIQTGSRSIESINLEGSIQFLSL